MSLDEKTQHKFRPKSVFADYLELPGLRNELRITLASYATTCDDFVPPRASEYLATIVLSLPPDVRPATTDYPSLDIPPPKDAHTQVQKPSASLFVRRGGEAYQFQPGGSLNLTELKLKPHGSVSGEAEFESAPTSDNPAMQFAGKFRAGLCRFKAQPEPQK